MTNSRTALPWDEWLKQSAEVIAEQRDRLTTRRSPGSELAAFLSRELAEPWPESMSSGTATLRSHVEVDPRRADMPTREALASMEERDRRVSDGIRNLELGEPFARLADEFAAGTYTRGPRPYQRAMLEAINRNVRGGV